MASAAQTELITNMILRVRDLSSEGFHSFSNQARGAQVNIQNIKESMQSLKDITIGNIFGGLGANEAANAVSGLKELGGSLITANANVEQLHQSFSVLYGGGASGSENADKALNFMKQFSLVAPFTRQSIFEAGKQIASLGLNITTVMPDLANMASAMGTSMPIAAQAMTDAFEGRFYMMQRDLHVTKDQLAQFGLLMDNTGHIIQSSLVTAIHNYVIATGEAGSPGHMSAIELQMTTFNGIMTNLTDQLQNFELAMGRPIFEVVKNNFANFIKMIGDQAASKTGSPLQSFEKNFGEAIARIGIYVFAAIRVIAEFGDNFRKTLGDSFATIKPILDSGVALFEWSVKRIQSVFSNIGDAEVTGALVFFGSVFGLVLGSITLAIGKWLLIFALIGEAVRKLSPELTPLVDLTKTVSGALSTLANYAMIFGRQLFDAIGMPIRLIIHDIAGLSGGISGALSGIQAPLIGMGTIIAGVFGNVFINIRQIIVALAPIAGTIFTQIAQTLSGTIAPAASVVITTWNSLATLITNTAPGINAAIVVIGTTIRAIATPVADIANTIFSTFTPVFTYIINGFTSLINPVSAAVQSIVNTLSSVGVSGNIGNIGTAIQASFSAIIPMLSTVISSIGGIVSSLSGPILATIAYIAGAIGNILIQTLPAFEKAAGLVTATIIRIGPPILTLARQIIAAFEPVAVTILNTFYGLAGPVTATISAVASALSNVGPGAFTAIAGAIQSIVVGFGNAAPAVEAAIRTVLTSLIQIGSTIITTVAPAISRIAAAFSALLPPIISTLSQIARVFTTNITQIIPPIASALLGLIGPITSIATALLSKVGPAAVQAFGTILSFIGTVSSGLASLVTGNLSTLVSILRTIGGIITTVVVTALNAFNGLVELIRNHTGLLLAGLALLGIAGFSVISRYILSAVNSLRVWLTEQQAARTAADALKQGLDIGPATAAYTAGIAKIDASLASLQTKFIQAKISQSEFIAESAKLQGQKTVATTRFEQIQSSPNAVKAANDDAEAKNKQRAASIALAEAQLKQVASDQQLFVAIARATEATAKATEATKQGAVAAALATEKIAIMNLQLGQATLVDVKKAEVARIAAEADLSMAEASRIAASATTQLAQADRMAAIATEAQAVATAKSATIAQGASTGPMRNLLSASRALVVGLREQAVAMLMAFAPLAILGLAITALGAIYNAHKKEIDSFLNTALAPLRDALGNLGQTFQRIGAQIVATVITWGPALHQFSVVVTQIATVVGSQLNIALGYLAQTVLPPLVGWFNQINAALGNMNNGSQGAAGSANILSAAWSAIVAVFSTVFTFLSQHIDTIQNQVQGFIQQIKGSFEIFFGIVQALMDTLVAVLTGNFSGLKDKLINDVIMIKTGFVDQFMGLIRQLSPIFLALGNFMVPVINGVEHGLNNLWNMFAGFAGNVIGLFASLGVLIADSMKTAFNSLLGSVVGMINAVIDKYQGFAGKLSFIGAPQIDKLQVPDTKNTIKQDAASASNAAAAATTTFLKGISPFWNDKQNAKGFTQADLDGFFNKLGLFLGDTAHAKQTGLFGPASGADRGAADDRKASFLQFNFPKGVKLDTQDQATYQQMMTTSIILKDMYNNGQLNGSKTQTELTLIRTEANNARKNALAFAGFSLTEQKEQTQLARAKNVQSFDVALGNIMNTHAAKIKLAIDSGALPLNAKLANISAANTEGNNAMKMVRDFSKGTHDILKTADYDPTKANQKLSGWFRSHLEAIKQENLSYMDPKDAEAVRKSQTDLLIGLNQQMVNALTKEQGKIQAIISFDPMKDTKDSVSEMHKRFATNEAILYKRMQDAQNAPGAQKGSPGFNESAFRAAQQAKEDYRAAVAKEMNYFDTLKAQHVKITSGDLSGLSLSDAFKKALLSSTPPKTPTAATGAGVDPNANARFAFAEEQKNILKHLKDMYLQDRSKYEVDLKNGADVKTLLADLGTVTKDYTAFVKQSYKLSPTILSPEDIKIRTEGATLPQYAQLIAVIEKQINNDTKNNAGAAVMSKDLYELRVAMVAAGRSQKQITDEMINAMSPYYKALESSDRAKLAVDTQQNAPANVLLADIKKVLQDMSKEQKNPDRNKLMAAQLAMLNASFGKLALGDRAALDTDIKSGNVTQQQMMADMNKYFNDLRLSGASQGAIQKATFEVQSEINKQIRAQMTSFDYGQKASALAGYQQASFGGSSVSFGLPGDNTSAQIIAKLERQVRQQEEEILYLKEALNEAKNANGHLNNIEGYLRTQGDPNNYQHTLLTDIKNNIASGHKAVAESLSQLGSRVYKDTKQGMSGQGSYANLP